MLEHDLEPRIVEGDYTENTAIEMADEVLALKPTAVFAPNDFAAIGLMQAFDDRGLGVPDDISVVGYDDTWLAGLARIGLSTVRQDPILIGSTVVGLLLERLDDGRAQAKHVVLEPTLTIRTTTGPAATRGTR
jgi:DNA-binding LacI/PurR family transcriptional regulator